jgi:hypothetical protein
MYEANFPVTTIDGARRTIELLDDPKSLRVLKAVPPAVPTNVNVKSERTGAPYAL